MTFISLARLTAMLALSSSVLAAPQVQLSVPAQLQLADTVAERYQILNKTEDFVFDFNKIPLANRKTFPALVGTGVALAVAELAGCGMAALHIHPRSAELFAVLSGRVYTEMITETGVVDANGNPRLVRTELGPKQMTVFPQGSFHAQMNPDCTPALAIAAFTSDDPGAALILPQAFAETDDFVLNAFGGAIGKEELAKFRKLMPKGAIFEVEECRKRCGL